MARLRHNVIANFVGQGWTALVGVLFLPLYIRLLGAESYGLIGIYVSMQGLLYVLDLGLSATLNRELARQAHTDSLSSESRRLVHTLEMVFWPICIVAACMIGALSLEIATHWLQPVELSRARVANALLLMGIAVGLQWPAAFYAGGLNGIERQVRANAITAVFSTLRWAGVVPLISWYDATIEAFLHWQIGVAAAQTVTTRMLLLRALPVGKGSRRFQLAILTQVRGFALGVFATSAVAFLLIQLDRIVLSSVLPLDQFGTYALAATVAAGLTRAFQPFFIALYPRFSGMVAAGEHDRLTLLYHQSNQYLAVLVSATAAVLVLFAPDVLTLWTGDPVLSRQAAPVLQILVAASALNGLMNLPYALQLANGWTRLSLLMNLAILPLATFATWRLAVANGGVGAASVWLCVNLAFVCIGIPLMHRRLLPREMSRWYLRDVLPPLGAATLAAVALKLALPAIDRGIAGLLTLAAIGLATLVAAGLATPATRALLRGLVRRPRPP